MEGYKDPFNRRTYPWGQENQLLVQHYRSLGALRKAQACLRLGGITFFHACAGRLGFTREWNGTRLRVYVNRSSDPWALPSEKLLFGQNLKTVAPGVLTLAPMGFCVTEEC